MIQDKLKDLKIKVTEIADYVNLSRPTLYKAMDLYDDGEFDSINKNVLKIFNYIDSNKGIEKKDVINYMLSIVDTKSLDSVDKEVVNRVKGYVNTNPTSEKTQFIDNAVSSSRYDLFIHYAMDVTPLLNKENLTPEEQNKVNLYNEIMGVYLHPELEKEERISIDLDDDFNLDDDLEIDSEKKLVIDSLKK